MIALRFKRGVFWSLVGALILRGSQLLSFILVARVLGKLGFGQFSIIQNTIITFGLFVGTSLSISATKYIAEFRDNNINRVGSIIILTEVTSFAVSISIAIIIVIFAPLLASKTLGDPNLVNPLRIGTILLLLTSVTTVQNGVLAGFEAFRVIAYRNLWSGILSFIFVSMGVYYFGINGALYGLTIGIGVNWILNYFAIRQQCHQFSISLQRSSWWNERHILLHYSLPAFLSSALVGPVLWTCNAMLVNQPHGYGEMGLFNAASQWRTAILFIPGAISPLILPLLSSLQVKSEQDARKLFIFSLTINGVIAGFIALIITILSKPIMKCYGLDFAQGNSILILMVWSAMFTSLAMVIGQLIASKNKMWIGLLFNAAWAIVLLLLSYVLLNKNYGALGIAVAMFISYFLHCFIQVIYAIRLSKTYCINNIIDLVE
ncbi:MAG: oligosaccharide flippase family protein [Armatimonadota bacterium]